MNCGGRFGRMMPLTSCASSVSGESAAAPLSIVRPPAPSRLTLPPRGARLSRSCACFRYAASKVRRSASPIVTPLNRVGLRTKKPSRMYQVYSRRSPQIGTRFGPRISSCSRSSKMYCCSFFQLSSRLATTCFMKASRSFSAGAAPSVSDAPSTAATSQMRRREGTGLTLSDDAERGEVSIGTALAQGLWMSMRLLSSAVLIAASTAFAAEIPVTVSDIVTGASSHVRITNTSRQPVTAWSLAATTEKPEGGTHREVYTTDGYLSEATHGLPKAAERLERLMPGESRQLPLDPLPAGAKVEVVATVLDDGTAMGDEKALASIFASRVKERDALKSVVD